MKTAASVSLYLTGVLVLAFAGDISYAAHFAAEATGVPPPAGTWTWTDLASIAAVVALVLGAISTALHVIAPRTKNKVDDGLAEKIDAALKFYAELQPLLQHIVKPTNGTSDDAARRFIAGDSTRATQTIIPALTVVDKVKP